MIRRTIQYFLIFRNKTRVWLEKPTTSKIRSLATKIQRFAQWVEDIAFEKIHGLDCSGYIPTDSLVTEYSASQAHARFYQAIRCAHIKELLREARKTALNFDNFIDLGSGKGKACFYASKKMKFKKIIGVEFSDPLVQAANDNKRAFKADNIDFVNLDASIFKLPSGINIIFLFNPFDEFILAKFLENNGDYFRRHQSLIAYANDHHRLTLTKFGFSTIYRNQNSRCSLHQYM
jgi:SAM-dependent methyltransferase